VSGIALVGGAGEGLGAALGRRFAKGGYEAVLSSRAQGERADLREEREVVDLFDRVEKRGPIEVAIFNPGANFRAPIADTPAEMFEKVWRLSCYAGFLFGREAARRMLARGRGTILFTGATASLRGAAQFAAFAAAKGGLRQVAQSMARELGPKNIHVAHVVIDGMIDNRRTRERMAERNGKDATELAPDSMLATDAIAEVFWQIHSQPRSAWSFETDLRPWAEKF
jgi:NAD(P)-dependent dehydrogenase (short-subunit alcohol dehydrogenase family)